jgi:hypothetical protein
MPRLRMSRSVPPLPICLYGVHRRITIHNNLYTTDLLRQCYSPSMEPPPPSLSFIYIYIYIYICMCVCVCVYKAGRILCDHILSTRSFSFLVRCSINSVICRVWSSVMVLLFLLWPEGGKRWRSWLRHCATSRNVAGSIPDGVIGIFH